VNFIKIFIVYILLEPFLLSLSHNQAYYLFVKFLGDGLIILLILLTMLKVPNLKLFKGQLPLIVIFFFVLVCLSTIANNLSILDFYLGLRSLFRYFLVFMVSFYYSLDEKSVNEVTGFLLKTYYFAFPIFLFNLIVNGSTDALYHTYLPQAIYINTLTAIILFRDKLSLRSYLFLSIFLVHAFLSTSRLAVLGILLQIAVYIVIFLRESLVKKSVFLIGLLSVGLLVLIATGNTSAITKSDTFQKISNTRFEASPDSNFRLYLATEFTRLSIREVNLIGDGPNTFGSQDFHKGYHYKLGFNENTLKYAADSHYTILLMRYGFIGMLAYYLMLAIMYLRTKAKYRPLMLPYLIFIVFASFALPVFSMRISSFIMFSLFGLTKR